MNEFSTAVVLEAGVAGCSDLTSVGAGLLANAVGQSQRMCPIGLVRQQAGSYSSTLK